MKTLLLVEDEKLIRQGVRSMIERSGVEIENIIEHIPIGRRIIEHVEKEVDSLLDIPKELGYCHAFWDLKEKILLNEFGLIWYSPSVINIFTCYD